jgi:hypothetical protein
MAIRIATACRVFGRNLGNRRANRRSALAAICVCVLISAGAQAQSPPPDATWTANADLEDTRTLTMDGLGAMQGVSFHDGKVYLYGDVWNAMPRVGVIREYTTDYSPTNRVIWLRKNGQPLLVHPTGLTWSEQWGTFLGDTVQTKAVIYHFDWARALADGNLDNAVLDIIADDAAANGCRPEFVTVQKKEFLATADYGDIRPEVRLYDPQALVQQKRTSAPGVVAYRFTCPPFNQNLSWDADRAQLTCIENVIAGRGWQLDVLNLPAAIADGRASGPGVGVRAQTFMPHDELEGYRPLAGGLGLFVTSSPRNNLVVGKIKSIQSKDSIPINPTTP